MVRLKTPPANVARYQEPCDTKTYFRRYVANGVECACFHWLSKKEENAKKKKQTDVRVVPKTDENSTRFQTLLISCAKPQNEKQT